MYKKLLITTAVLAASYSQAELMITGVVDGPLSGGLPKAIELYATDAIADLSVYSIEGIGAGGTSGSNVFSFPAQALAAGSYFWVTNNEAGFQEYFGFAADGVGTLGNNGDDIYVLKTSAATIDIYGELGVDGTGTAWEFLDGWAYRKHTTAPNGGTFDAAQWNYSGINALDGSSSNTTMPVKGVVPAGPTIPDVGSCGDPATLISEVQGNGNSSSLENEYVVVEAIVNFDAQGDGSSFQYSGFFLQEEDSDMDADPSTSEGIFVYDFANAVASGDLVRLVGQVAEFNGITQIKDLDTLTVCSSGHPLPTPTSLTFPLTSLDQLEAVEGMGVTIDTPMVVSDFYGTGYGFINYGQFVASSKLHYQPTTLAAPSVESYNNAITAFKLDSILIDDGVAASNPDVIPFPTAAGYSNTNYFRVGFELSNLAGVVHGYDNGSTKLPYSLIPSTSPTFIPTAKYDRTLEPYIDGSENLVIASMNVLNLFNGIENEADETFFPTLTEEKNKTFGDYRGANSAEDYAIQLSKIVAAISAMDADIVGLMEIENDGFGEKSSIKALTDALNAEVAVENEYAFVNAGEKIGDDAIAVGLLYRKNVLSPVGTTVILDSANSPLDENNEPLFLDTKNRPSLIQTLKHHESDQAITIAVNHLKSKGSNCNALSDPDLGDGAGNCNITRSRAAQALATFLSDNPTGVETNNIIMVGDFNSYAKEDPIVALETAGFTNLKDTDKSTEEIPFSYSYSGLLGSLDYIIGSEAMTENLLSIDAWHINSIESDVLDYDTTLDPYEKNDTYASADDPYYSSDHDPIVAAFYLATTKDDQDEDDQDEDDNSSDKPKKGGSLSWSVLMLGLLAVLSRRKTAAAK
ncbi:ExeM/NucH family extracellular endonuclease [Reinekea sp. G2M2-21]|uniref:ExeM/NucH family extracellular endonuclease n=1 Tax=Reinekea sp. G2M2-21 TaxID=2788942 RepID=UPI0018AC6A06|nr:ExeM/NucH family extracellular endonuclease [Reinekea sp. G2M2-21]